MLGALCHLGADAWCSVLGALVLLLFVGVTFEPQFLRRTLSGLVGFVCLGSPLWAVCAAGFGWCGSGWMERLWRLGVPAARLGSV